MQMQTLAIIPTYNERDNIQPLVTAVLAAEPSLDVLIVDDASPDGTGEIAETLARESSRVRVMHRPGKQGLGTAYVAGFQYALAGGYDRVVEMDADFSHRPEDLPRLLEAAETADVVVGSRKVRGGRVVGWSPLRHILSAGGSLYTRLVLGLPVKDCTSGFMCLHRSVLSALDFARMRSNGYSFLLEMKYLCYRSGFRLVEVPIVFPDRKVGRSKMSLAIILEAMARVWGLRVGLS